MRYLICVMTAALLSSCAHEPKCGNLAGAKTILTGEKTCSVRTRQVVIGSELNVPDSLKKSNLSGFELQWIDPEIKNGSVELGHFVLIQSTKAIP